jgi:hypothetical protein
MAEALAVIGAAGAVANINRRSRQNDKIPPRPAQPLARRGFHFAQLDRAVNSPTSRFIHDPGMDRRDGRALSGSLSSAPNANAMRHAIYLIRG